MKHSKRSRCYVQDGAGVPAFFLYGEPLRPPDEGTVHVETIESRSRLHNWKIRPHRHQDLHQILIVRRGLVDCRIDSAHSELRGPAVVSVPAGAIHAFGFASDTDGFVVTFAAGLMREVARSGEPALGRLDRPVAVELRRDEFASTDLEALSRLLYREFGRSAVGRDGILRSLLAALLVNLQRLAIVRVALATTPANRARDLVVRFRESVERGYREHRGIGVYAQQLGASEATLRKACLIVAGQSPIELIHSRLLIEAERQLRYTGLPVTEIAYSLGFEDPAYFTRFFKARAGLSPRGFRQRGAEHRVN